MHGNDLDSLTRMILGLLVYRLGGEQTFTISEIDEIRQVIHGVQIFLSSDGNKIIVRARGREYVEDLKANGAMIL